MNKRFLAIIRKELIHIVRDYRSLFITIVMPLLMVIIYGNAIKLDIKEIPLGVIDYNRTHFSRQLIDKFIQSGYFKLAAFPDQQGEIEHLFKRREIKVALVIPADFSRDIHTNAHTQIQCIIDGSNSNTATVINNYVKVILTQYSMELNSQIAKLAIQIESRVWYNPDLDSAHFIIPGLVAVILMMICALLTSITIAKEKETGTMEQILVSPIKPLEIIFGKVLPYVIISFIDGALILIAARFGFGIPIKGSILLLALLSLVYVYAALSIGVFISTRVKTQQIAMMVALLITILPSIMLSGFIFPIASMPLVLKIISYIVPAKYFLVIIRGIVLKDATFSVLWIQTLFLFMLGSILLLSSTAKFKTKLDD